MLKQATRPAYQVFLSDGSTAQVDRDREGRDTAAEMLECGGIIYFPVSPFKRSAEDQSLLLSQHQKDAAYHKNIAYRPLEDRITGIQKVDQVELDRLRRVMRDFSKQAIELFEQTFPPYVNGYNLDFASFRPLEEQGRKMRLRARNDLIHVDSFPTRPVFGDRILRVFENCSSDRVRVWRTSDNFDVLVEQFRLQRPQPGDLNKSPHSVPALLKLLGMKANAGSPYDKWMLDFHNFLKENPRFQESCRKNVWEFPPGSAWIVYTDMVSHSVLSGQYALEQTFIVSQRHMVRPDKTPINILRRAYNQ